MENTSKALLMAAGVLIGIMILSIAVYLAASFGSDAAEVNEQIRRNQVNQFNSQFTKFNGKKDATIHDILTIANLAIDNNKTYELTEAGASNYYISVKKDNIRMEKINIDNYIKSNLMASEFENGELKRYTCTVHINEITERVDQVNFTSNK
ncbi:MAG: hypothetical protein IKF17_06095 [Clostridia bacterium]|nr:hypothetical protein [Clostridia bacterium]